MTQRPSLVDTQAAAVIVADLTGRPCSPATIRYWAHKAWITRRGHAHRRTLYDPVEVHRHAAHHLALTNR